MSAQLLTEKREARQLQSPVSDRSLEVCSEGRGRWGSVD